ncbi:hypothetical protein H310_12663 [Aphanomyces invadans]|uniref:Uncharacterized protein n=1 Tax=Aphanomyces invadans TaxID=157072 RepID=A0A024THH9_9STRA|nr:hypothetical protein H310_12663 [Aphanomyces invadans]ETV93419.1 hypothetical protein H310_12663 [Aphanomyces invadans]|eukprot:XP_008878055.1 hypothetical protein H310_12663 [Aphanomyces invadans]
MHTVVNDMTPATATSPRGRADAGDVSSKRQYYKEWYEKNKLKRKAYNARNKDHVREWHAKNRDRVLQHKRKYRENNREKEKERHKRYFEANRDKILERARAYRAKNKDKRHAYDKAYKEKHKKLELAVRLQQHDSPSSQGLLQLLAGVVTTSPADPACAPTVHRHMQLSFILNADKAT